MRSKRINCDCGGELIKVAGSEEWIIARCTSCQIEKLIKNEIWFTKKAS